MEKAEERESKAQLLAKDLKTLQAENKSLVKKFTQSNKTWWLYRWQPSTKLSINRVWLKIRSGDIASLHEELSSSIEKFLHIWNQVTELFQPILNYSTQYSIQITTTPPPPPQHQGLLFSTKKRIEGIAFFQSTCGSQSHNLERTETNSLDLTRFCTEAGQENVRWMPIFFPITSMTC